MRILHLIPSLRKGGAERLALDIVRHLNTLESVEAILAIMQPVNEYASEYKDIQPILVSSFVIPSIKGTWNIATAAWDQLVQDFKPDVIHTHLFEAEMLCHYQPILGVRYVSHLHDNMKPFLKLRGKDWFRKKRLTEAYERNFMLRQYAKVNQHFIAISPDTQTYFQENLPARFHSSIHLLPNAIDIEKFSQCPAQAPKGQIQLVNVGSFVPKKNQIFLVEVAHELQLRNIDFKLIMAGDGPLRAEVNQAIQNHGLEAQVQAPGNFPEIEKLLGASHVYVHSAYYEPFGLVLIEAMAAGLPVVCLDGKGNRELIHSGSNGFMVDPPDARVFAERILACASSTEQWQRMSMHAHTFASDFDIKNYVHKLYKIYSQ